MKTSLVILLFIFILKTSYSQSEWKWIAPDPPNKMVFSSTVTDDKAYFWCEHNSVIKLDLKTENFEMLPTYAPYENCVPASFATQGIGFADSMTGYITDVCHGEYRTTDGGYNWIKTANVGSNISLVTFGTSQVGWKLGIGGFYKTVNAGASWINMGNLFGVGGEFSKIFSLNQNQLWVLKSSYYDGSGSGIWYSPNGGTNWVNVNTGLQSNNQNRVFYYDFKMSTSGIGFIIGSEYKPLTNSREAVILKTTDMGLTWTVTKYPEEQFRFILFISDNEWVILGDNGDYTSNKSAIIQRRTSDAGNSWIFSKPLVKFVNNTYFYNSFYYPSKDAIYFYAVGGIYKSLDRGITYQRITSEKDVFVNNIAFDSKPKNKNNQLGIAWLQWNVKPYLITYDGGQTWHKKSLPQSIGSIWLVGIAEEVIYMIVDQSKLYKSTDLGETWNQLDIPVHYSGLQALSVYNKDIVVLNAYKNLVSTTDGGSSWILGPTLENVWLQETDISKPGNIVAIGAYHDSLGEKGCFFNTSNFGLSWHLFDTDNEMKDITMVDERIGFALGNKKLYKTTDRGQYWKILRTSGIDAFQSFSCFAFRDTLNGVLYSNEGMNITTDGCKNWQKVDYRIPFAGVDKMEYNTNGDLFIISNGSMLMLPATQNLSPKTNNTLNKSVTEHYLFSNFPNPFNNLSTIKYYIPATSRVIIKIFNTLGEEIETLIDEVKPSGMYQVTWIAKDLPSGVYYYRIQAGSFVQTKKMILLK